NLQRAKTEATNAITHASDLNQAQKNALTQQVNSAQNVKAVNDIKHTTQSLNTAMTGLNVALLIITKSYKVIIMSTQILIRK
ncbi:GA module-containing protein, partial [Staphylococcus aureus]